MSGDTIGWNTNKFALLMVVHDLSLVGTLRCPDKADTVLVTLPTRGWGHAQGGGINGHFWECTRLPGLVPG
jgi:hypothetical protein